MGGTGGSRTPVPVSFFGGPPDRAEEASGSSSNSFPRIRRAREKRTPPGRHVSSEANNTGIKPPPHRCGLNEAEDNFDGDPGCDRVAGGVVRGDKFPGAYRFDGAFVEPQADSLDQLNL